MRLRAAALLLAGAAAMAQQAFHYNRENGLDPLTVGMKNDQPMAVDWDGDGVVDLLHRNIYSTAVGEPWWGLYFSHNRGTNAKPQFEHWVRLSADGAVLQDPYASYQLIDWNNDGDLDVLCGVGSGPERGVLKVYLNTGRRDARKLPVLTAGPRVPWSDGGALTYGMRIFGPDLFTLRLRVQYFPTQETDCVLFRHRREGAGFSAGEPMSLAGKTVYEDWPSTMLDVTGDGAPDLVGATRSLMTKPPKSCVTAWENTGTARQPAFAKPAACLIDTSPEGFAIPSPGFGGLLVSHMGGWLRHYRQLGVGRWSAPQTVLAEGMPCSFGGYSSVEVADWEGDGDLDFIGGNEIGFVQLIENISAPGRQQFATVKSIPLTNGDAMYAGRWQFIDDPDPERPLGQSKPAYVDWDNDGDLDLLVGNNSNRVAYFENVGTRRQPRFVPNRALRHDAGDHFSFRARTAPVDWNGDGLVDLVAGYAGARNRNDGPDIAISLYLRYRDASGALRLKAPEVLRSVSGEPLRTPIPYHHGFEAVDWDGDGDYDLFTNERKQVVFYRNTGNRFQRELVQFRGEPLSISHHETSVKAIDWDKDGKLDLITGGESGWIYFFPRGVITIP